jgi:5-methylcytosine-specific restriction endonuclease McrA
MLKDKRNKIKVPYELKVSLKAAANHRCVLCNIKESQWVKLEIHHIVHRKHGGTNDPSNLMPVCSLCHSKLHSNG